ncbi:MAG: hypothetical protein ACJAYZ_001292 [Bacteroidia bacterium]
MIYRSISDRSGRVNDKNGIGSEANYCLLTCVRTNEEVHCYTYMFGLFKKKSEKEKLEDQYEKLLAETHKLSTVNRTASDAKAAEADAVLKKIEAMD